MAKAKALPPSPPPSLPAPPEPSLSLPPDLVSRIGAFAAEVGADPLDVVTRAVDVLCTPAMQAKAQSRVAAGKHWLLGRP